MPPRQKPSGWIEYVMKIPRQRKTREQIGLLGSPRRADLQGRYVHGVGLANRMKSIGDISLRWQMLLVPLLLILAILVIGCGQLPPADRRGRGHDAAVQ